MFDICRADRGLKKTSRSKCKGRRKKIVRPNPGRGVYSARPVREGRMQRVRSLLLVAVAAAAVASSNAWGQAYPTRPVRVIVSAAAGGPSDVIGRIVAQKLSERLGAQV